MKSVRIDGEMLRRFRLDAGLTQEALAAAVGCSDRLIRKAEAGGPIGTETLADFITVFNDAGCQPPVTLSDLTLAEDNLRDLAHVWFDTAFNRRDPGCVDRFMHPDVEIYVEGTVNHGRDAIRRRVETILAGFAELTITVEQTHVSEDSLVVYWCVVKRHTGTFLGIEPTGRWADVRGSSMVTFRDGLIATVRDHWDVQDLIQQLTGPADSTDRSPDPKTAPPERTENP